MKRRYKQLLEKFYKEENKELIKLLELKLYKKYGTNKKCFICGNKLLISDLKHYKYLCLNCNENFYEIEIK